MTTPETPSSIGDMLARTRRRAEQMRRRRRTAVAAVAALGVAIVIAVPVALANNSHHGRVVGVVGEPTSLGAAPTTVTTTPTPTPTSPTPYVTLPTTSTTRPAAVPQCATSQLTASLANPSGAMGSVGYDLIFVNRGSAACALRGYPGVSYVTGSSGKTVGAPAQRDSVNSVVTVVLAPGKAARALLIEVNALNYPTDTCRLTSVTGLRIYPPNQTAALFVAQSTQTCGNPAVYVLGVGAVQPTP